MHSVDIEFANSKKIKKETKTGICFSTPASSPQAEWWSERRKGLIVCSIE